MNRLCSILAVGFAVFATPMAALAQNVVYTSTSGDTYVMQCNRDGYVLSVLPLGAKVYLGRSCDAYSDFFGTGHWCTANGGTGFTIGNFSAFFEDQEPFCPGVGFSPHSCLCADM